MTSLFRRSSSSNGGSRSGGGGGGDGDGGGGGGQLNNSRPNRQVRRLEFNQAMEDFKTMFPSMDYEVIECVLRSNNGAVDATIDQLLQMSIDGQGSDDSSDSDDSIPPEVSPAPFGPEANVGASVLSSVTFLSRFWSERWNPTARTRSRRRSILLQRMTCTFMTGSTPKLHLHHHRGSAEGLRALINVSCSSGVSLLISRSAKLANELTLMVL